MARQRVPRTRTRIRIRKNDLVEVITGRDRGKRGKVLQVLPEKARVIVQGVNFIKRHTRPNPQRNVQGGIVEKEAPLHISKIALWNPAAKQGDRVGIRVLADGRRVRFFKSNKEVVDA
jgi:large subunit ribosomal protein L24